MPGVAVARRRSRVDGVLAVQIEDRLWRAGTCCAAPFDPRAAPRRLIRRRDLVYDRPVGRTGRYLAVVVLVVLAAASGASAATLTAACSGMTGDSASLVNAIASANASGGSNVVALGRGCVYSL